MTIRVACDCGKRFLLDDSAAGTSIRCYNCGDVIRISRRKRRRQSEIHQEQDLNDLPIHYGRETPPDTPESTTNRLIIDATARLIGIGLAIYTGIVSLSVFGDFGGVALARDNTRSLKILWFVFVGIPGLYIAIKGVNFSPSAAINRQKGWAYIAGGIGLMIAAVATTALVSYVFTIILGPTAVLGIGMFATGAIAAIAGVVAVITGQDMGNALKEGGDKPRKRKSRRKRNG